MHYALTEGQKGFTVAVALYGTVAGAILSGPLGQRIGSRAALRWMGLLYLISALGCALAGSWWTLLVFRALGGLGIGGSSVLGPVYIAELAPAKSRGRLVGLFQINIVIGILLAYLSNAIVAHLVPSLAVQWRWQFAGAPAGRVVCFASALCSAQLAVAGFAEPIRRSAADPVPVGLAGFRG